MEITKRMKLRMLGESMERVTNALRIAMYENDMEHFKKCKIQFISLLDTSTNVIQDKDLHSIKEWQDAEKTSMKYREEKRVRESKGLSNRATK